MPNAEMPTVWLRGFVKNQADCDGTLLMLMLKVRDRLAKISALYARMQEAAHSKREHTDGDGPPLPFLYQG